MSRLKPSLTVSTLGAATVLNASRCPALRRSAPPALPVRLPKTVKVLYPFASRRSAPTSVRAPSNGGVSLYGRFAAWSVARVLGGENGHLGNVGLVECFALLENRIAVGGRRRTADQELAVGVEGPPAVSEGF